MEFSKSKKFNIPNPILLLCILDFFLFFSSCHRHPCLHRCHVTAIFIGRHHNYLFLPFLVKEVDVEDPS